MFNSAYRVLWSEACRQWVVARKLAGTLGKKGGSGALAVVLVLALGASQPADAAPIGGQVTAGSGSISQSGTTTTIRQQSQHLSLGWQSFNVAPKESVNFRQPNAQAIAVNRIHDINGSQILGHINANGQVYLINPNGVLFGQGAQVNVGGLVASTLDIPDNQIGNATQIFAGSGKGSIVNNGALHAADGGYVALLGNSVTNNGVITARLGTAAMGAGNQETLSFSGNHLLNIQVDKSVIDSLAANHGLIHADGGYVAMTAGARDSLLASVVNNDGIVQAQTVQNKNGHILLLGGMAAGTTKVNGTLDASAPANGNGGGNGGFIETSAATAKVADTAKITTQAAHGQTGTWLIDPQDFTIGATSATGDITGTALSNNLSGGNVTIQSSTGGTAGSGNINVNDAVNWNANTLTLTAAKDVNINAVMAATGTAGLALNPATGNGADTAVAGGMVNTKLGNGGFIGKVNFSGTGTLSIGGTSYIVISSLGVATDATSVPATPSLQGMAATANLAGHYVLGSDIDASATSGWNGGAGFAPIGSSSAVVFTGIFNGLGHTITGLTINRSTNNIGLFGVTGNSSTLRNVGLSGGAVSGVNSIGGLVGFSSSSSISNSYATGTVSGGGSQIGGLVGYLNVGSISNSYATGAVNVGGGASLGGLVGVSNGSISNSYATGAVNSIGGGPIGGLVGFSSGSISNSYATGAVSGNLLVGGLVGVSPPPGTISNSYATGAVANGQMVTGLAFAASVNNSYWDTQTTGLSSNRGGGGTGLTTAQMHDHTNFSGWDFNKTWIQYDGHTAPLLRSFMTPLTVTANNQSKTYDGATFSGGNGVSYSTTTNSNLSGTVAFSGTWQGAKTVGSSPYTIIPSGLYSNQQGFSISYADGALTINPKPLTLSGTITAANKVYDATKTATLNANGAILLGKVSSDTVSLKVQSTGQFIDKNVGQAKQVNVSSQSLTGANASNYSLTATTTANITPKALTISGLTATNKVYDSTTNDPLGGTAAITALGNDVVALVGTAAGSFANKAVGTGKAVTVGITNLSLGGTDAGNYTLLTQTGLSADITKANLGYAATLTSVTQGQILPAFSGLVTGFMGSDTQATATSGTLTFSSPVTNSNTPGQFAIDGSGLTAVNYVFTQAPGNATALTIQQGTPPAAVTHVVTNAQHTGSGQRGDAGQGGSDLGDFADLSNTNNVSENSDASSSTGSNGSSNSKDDSGSQSSSGTNSSNNSSGNGGDDSLHLMMKNGGVRLPDHLL